MAYTYHDLKSKKVTELRELAKTTENEELKGAQQMNKDHLLPILCKALGIDMHAHHHAVGIDKPALKAKIKSLKAQRADALAKHDYDLLKNVRRQIHRINRDIRRHLE
jgi:hypothetical protein